jgi:hypothetical protein
MNGKIIVTASALIAILAIIAAGAGLFWNGLYASDTKSVAIMAEGNDLVTLALAVPLLLVSTYHAAKGSLRGRLIWTGAIFYFLYTYAMACFITAYNPLFLAYVAIGSLSLYTLAASLLTLDINKVKESLIAAPVKATTAFMFLVSITLSAQWLGNIVPGLMNGERPGLLESYTTLVAQAMDLGILVPLGILTGMLLLRRNAWGYALASIFLIKGITYGTAVLSMALFMSLNGVEVFVPFALAIATLVACATVLAVAFYGHMRVPAAAGKVTMT